MRLEGEHPSARAYKSCKQPRVVSGMRSNVQHRHPWSGKPLDYRDSLWFMASGKQDQPKPHWVFLMCLEPRRPLP